MTKMNATVPFGAEGANWLAPLTLDGKKIALVYLMGWRWSSIAAEVGPAAAANHAVLPDYDEAAARAFAADIASHPEKVERLRKHASAATERAVDAHRAYLPSFRRVRDENTRISKREWLELSRAIWVAEGLGQAAAKSNYVLMLVERELEGAR